MRFVAIFLSTSLVLLAAPAANQPAGLESRSWEAAPTFRSDRDAAVAALPAISPTAAGAFQTAEDGTRFLTLRFRSSAAAATRLHLTDMHMPAGARVFVYGIENGQATDIAGPYLTAGSNIDASLWTAAVRGSEIVLELQEGSETIADLPFTVAEIAAVPASELGTEPTPAEREVRTSMFRGMPVTHEVVDGLAVFECDVILGEVRDLAPAAGSKSVSRSAVAITGSNYRWPGGVIPYSIDPTTPNTARITDAVAHWNTVMAGVVKLIPRTNENAYLYFYHTSSPGQCASSVGRLGYGQYLYVGDYCSTGNMIHEIGHAYGLWHEQSREDRNNYIKINWANIDPNTTYNFSQNISDGDDIGAYDYGSVMHYNAYAFSINGQPTIETIPAGIAIGQRSGLSTGDIAAIKVLYGATVPVVPPAPTPVAVTISSNVASVPLVVDGTSYTASTTFSWLPGSSHTVSATVSYTSAAGRYSFVNWSDGGAAEHAYTTPASATALKANYSIAYPVTTVVSGLGTASVTPASPDGYYAAQSAVTVQAVPAAGYCFSGWTGLISGTPSTTSLTVGKPYSLTANFVTGSVTLAQSSLLPPANGGNFSVNVSANTGCSWTVVSSADWVRPGSTAPASGSAAINIRVEPNNTKLIRSAVVKIGSATLYVTQVPKW